MKLLTGRVWDGDFVGLFYVGTIYPGSGRVGSSHQPAQKISGVLMRFKEGGSVTGIGEGLQSLAY